MTRNTSKAILPAVLILLTVVPAAGAEEKKLGIKLGVNYLSSYLFRGSDLYGEGHSAIQPNIDIDFYGTGFGLNVLSSRANSSGFEDIEELDICLKYSNNLFEGQTYTTAYTIGWVYYDYPDRASKGPKTQTRPLIPVAHTLADLQEIYTVFAWPKITGIEGLVPCYIVAHAWPARSHSNATDNGGWVHAFGLNYDVPMNVLSPDLPAKQILKLISLAAYNSGVGATGNVDHDWSHAVFGLLTDFKLTENLTFTPGIYYQVSMDDSINDDDETWCGLTMTYSF